MSRKVDHRPTKPGAACSNQAGRATRRRSAAYLADMLAILHGSIEAAEAEADRRVNAIMWGAMAGAGRVPLSTALRRARRGDA